MLDKVGLDAVAFLRFLRLLRWMFTAVAVVACGVLIPINLVYNLRNPPKGSSDILNELTIANVKTNILFAHVAVSYLICTSLSSSWC